MVLGREAVVPKNKKRVQRRNAGHVRFFKFGFSNWIATNDTYVINTKFSYTQ